MRVCGFSKVHWQSISGQDDPDSTVTLFFDEPPCLEPNAITAVVIGSTRHKAIGYRLIGDIRPWHAITLEWSAAGVSVGDEVTIEVAL